MFFLYLSFMMEKAKSLIWCFHLVSYSYFRRLILMQRSHLAQYYVNTQTASLTVAVSLKGMTLVSTYTSCEHLHVSFCSLYYHTGKMLFHIFSLIALLSLLHFCFKLSLTSTLILTCLPFPITTNVLTFSTIF